MKITINDKLIEVDENITLQDVLIGQDISLQGIATAVNGTVVPATLRGATCISDGDNIVIIKAFYGG